jgi:hypothetical protein
MRSHYDHDVTTDRLFPYDAMFNWLSYGKSSAPQAATLMDDPDRHYFSRREWSFTLEDDVYIRYQACTPSSLRCIRYFIVSNVYIRASRMRRRCRRR